MKLFTPLERRLFRLRKISVYRPHQGKQERKRRLRQIALGRLNGRIVSPEAHLASQDMSKWL